MLKGRIPLQDTRASILISVEVIGTKSSCICTLYASATAYHHPIFSKCMHSELLELSLGNCTVQPSILLLQITYGTKCKLSRERSQRMTRLGSKLYTKQNSQGQQKGHKPHLAMVFSILCLWQEADSFEETNHSTCHRTDLNTEVQTKLQS